jgi:hypothetical protein
MTILSKYVVEGGSEGPRFFTLRSEADAYAKKHGGGVLEVETPEKLGAYLQKTISPEQRAAWEQEFSGVAFPADIETAARAEWDCSPQLQAEFRSDFGGFLAYRWAEARGLIRGKRKNTGCFSLDLGSAARKEWEEKPDLRVEFGRFETFLAYLQAADRGLVSP